MTSIAAVVALRNWRNGRPILQPVARVLAVGSALLILSATASPHSWPPERDGFGDLVLELGRGGLGQLHQALAAPGSLAAILLYANVLLYVPLTFWACLGWPARAGSILLAALCLSLAIEALQFIALDRVAATDDFLLNGAGALLGLALGLAARRLLRREPRVREPSNPT